MSVNSIIGHHCFYSQKAIEERVSPHLYFVKDPSNGSVRGRWVTLLDESKKGYPEGSIFRNDQVYLGTLVDPD